MKQVEGEGAKWYRGPQIYPGPEHEWEREVLALIAEQIAIPMDLLTKFLGFSNDEETEKLMERFAKYRWIGAKKFLVNDETWVWLRQAGAEHSGTGFRAVAPKVWGLPHRRAVSVMRLKLEREYPGSTWICERKLWQRKYETHHVPDGVLVVRNKQGKLEELAIEVELSAKQAERYREIVVNRYARYDRVLYYCTPFIARMLKRVPDVGDSPRVWIFEEFKDPSHVKQFQWMWSEWSGPGEVGAYRQLEPWEVAIVRLISEQGTMPVDQLARFLDRDYATAQRIANHLDAAGFISQGRGPVDDPPWLWTTKMGGRLAGTGLNRWSPNPTSVESFRLWNEARLLVHELDPTVRWWGMRLLRKRAEDKSVPVALIEEGDEQHAVEVEFAKSGRVELIEKYNRRCGQFQVVVVFCSSRRVRTFERLSKECGWDNMIVRSFKPLDRPGRKPRVRKEPLRLTEIPLEEIEEKVPGEVMEAVRRAERLVTPPNLKSLGRYKGRGFPRWRVITESGKKWHVAETPHGWFVRPIAAKDEPLETVTPQVVEEALSAAELRRRRARPPARAMKKVPPKDLPKEAARAIQVAGNMAFLPTVRTVKQRRSPGFRRYLVETDAGRWRVAENPPRGWVARLAREDEEAARDYRKTRWPKAPEGTMREVEPWDVPYAVIEAIREAAGMLWPPKVIAAEERCGKGANRWRIETEDADTWRVTKSQHGWSAGLSE